MAGGSETDIDTNGDSCLHLAAKYGHCDVVKTLLEWGADLLIVNALGETALETANNCGHTAVGAILIEWANRPALPNGMARARPKRRPSVTSFSPTSPGVIHVPRIHLYMTHMLYAQERSDWQPPGGEVPMRQRSALIDADFEKEAHEEYLKARV